jgi:hypothetical protein
LPLGISCAAKLPCNLVHTGMYRDLIYPGTHVRLPYHQLYQRARYAPLSESITLRQQRVRYWRATKGGEIYFCCADLARVRALDSTDCHNIPHEQTHVVFEPDAPGKYGAHMMALNFPAAVAYLMRTREGWVGAVVSALAGLAREPVPPWAVRRRGRDARKRALAALGDLADSARPVHNP